MMQYRISWSLARFKVNTLFRVLNKYIFCVMCVSTCEPMAQHICGSQRKISNTSLPFHLACDRLSCRSGVQQVSSPVSDQSVSDRCLLPNHRDYSFMLRCLASMRILGTWPHAPMLAKQPLCPFHWAISPALLLDIFKSYILVICFPFVGILVSYKDEYL